MARSGRTALLLCLSFLPGLAHAACEDPSYKQFDFWLGDWSVTKPDGKPAGHNHIEKLYSGCVLQEHWTSASGGAGSSFNIYDGARHVWHQTWVDSSGALLELEGGLKDGSMVMRGEQVQPDGKILLNRITWTPKDGNIRQLWEVSSDAGKTWSVAFDGLYRKVH